MSVNDKQLNQGFGADVYPGSANPTSSSNHANPMRTNFVDDPTTASRGAGAGSNFDGDRQAQRNFSQTAGVVEGRPGIIESTHIDPLSETANKDNGWANATQIPRTQAGITSTAKNIATSAATVASGTAQAAYGFAMGDEQAKKAGKEAVFGK